MRNGIIDGVERNVPMNALTVTEPANADVEVGIERRAQKLAHTRARKTVLQRTPPVFFSLPLFS